MKRNMDLVRKFLLKLESLPIKSGGIMAIDYEDELLAVPGDRVDENHYHIDQIKTPVLLIVAAQTQ